MNANDLTVLLTLPHQARPVVGEQRLQEQEGSAWLMAQRMSG